jgi:hypothetical protein
VRLTDALSLCCGTSPRNIAVYDRVDEQDQLVDMPNRQLPRRGSIVRQRPKRLCTRENTKFRNKALQEEKMNHARIRLLGLVLLGLLCTPFTKAQDNATVNGTITDASGALVPNAAIALTNLATGQTRDATSNSAGVYRFANVGIGTYTLTVSAAGFQKYTKAGIVVNVTQTLEENVGLTVGSQAQTVSVQADTLQVQTETNEVSNLITGEQVS